MKYTQEEVCFKHQLITVLPQQGYMNNLFNIYGVILKGRK